MTIFIRQVQSIVYTMLLQALTTKLTDSPLSVCSAGDANLSWMGECCTIIMHQRALMQGCATSGLGGWSPADWCGVFFFFFNPKSLNSTHQSITRFRDLEPRSRHTALSPL